MICNECPENETCCKCDKCNMNCTDLVHDKCCDPNEPCQFEVKP